MLPVSQRLRLLLLLTECSAGVSDFGSPISTRFDETTYDAGDREDLERPEEGVPEDEIPSEERMEEPGITYEETELMAWTERSVRMVHFLDKNFTSAEKESGE